MRGKGLLLDDLLFPSTWALVEGRVVLPCLPGCFCSSLSPQGSFGLLSLIRENDRFPCLIPGPLPPNFNGF